MVGRHAMYLSLQQAVFCISLPFSSAALILLKRCKFPVRTSPSSSTQGTENTSSFNAGDALCCCPFVSPSDA